MGIRNMNIATCNVCGRYIMSKETQKDLLRIITEEKGWKGNMNDLICDKCIEGSKNSLIYSGKYNGITTNQGEVFLEITNPRVTVLIPYSDFFGLPLKNEKVTAAEIEQRLVRAGFSKDKIYYKNTKNKNGRLVAELLKDKSGERK